MIFLVIDFTSFADALESEVVRRCLARRMAVNRRFGYRRKLGRIATATAMAFARRCLLDLSFATAF
jgi:hypothetical protein